MDRVLITEEDVLEIEQRSDESFKTWRILTFDDLKKMVEWK
jgi:hypothetical protein